MPIADTEKNVKQCICAKCPTYPKQGGLFCARDKSRKPVKKKTCICVDCSLWQEQIRLACFFCFYGAAV